jgi:KaiC/GvpD/RAD55 family RecA-like ATPase
MDYTLATDDTERQVPPGTNLLLVHPSTGETDRVDTDFLRTDTDRYLVVSTRTTAREVRQKLEHYDVDQDRAVILDTLSVERGYSRRSSEDVHYVSSPDDIDGIVAQVEQFLADNTDAGKVRVSFDSVTELAYYAGEEAARGAVERMLDLICDHGAVSLFHLSGEVHDEAEIDAYRELFDGVLELDETGALTVELDI